MKPSVWHRMDVFSRQLTPVLLCLLLVLVSAVPYQVPGLARVMPVLALIAIYHWGVYRSELLPVYAVFLIGFFQDALSGAPMGVHTVVFVMAYSVVLAQHRFFFGKSFVVVWLGFVLVSAGASLLMWMLVSAFNGAAVDPYAVALQYALGVGCYPVIAYLLSRWQRAFLQQV
ncbi:MAG: rod shape-determining protein MreD [Rhodospirillaceae bacterium]